VTPNTARMRWSVRYANDDGRAPTGNGGTADLSPDPRAGEISSGLITILLNFE
jgi:hypothetical protein